MFSAKLCEWGIGLLTSANTGYTLEVTFSAICDQWGIYGHSQCSQYKLRPLEGMKCDRRDFYMSKKTRALNKDEYRLIIDCIKKGFDMPEGTVVKANPRIAMALQCEALLGLRISDILRLRLDQFIADGSNYFVEVKEQKTGKTKKCFVPLELYCTIRQYADEWGIGLHQPLFDITPRSVQRHLGKVCSYLGLTQVSTHSFRKYYATDIYKRSGSNIDLVRQLLNHSDCKTTQRYIRVDPQELSKAVAEHCRDALKN